MSRRVVIAAGAYAVELDPSFNLAPYIVRRLDVPQHLAGARPTRHKRIVGVMYRFEQNGIRLTDSDVRLIASLGECRDDTVSAPPPPPETPT